MDTEKTQVRAFLLLTHAFSSHRFGQAHGKPHLGNINGVPFGTFASGRFGRHRASPCAILDRPTL